MRSNDKKAALSVIVDCVSESEHKREIRAILKGQKIINIAQLMLLRDTEVETMTLLEEGIDDQNKKIITSTPVSKTCLSTIKDLKDFTLFLNTTSNLSDIKDLTVEAFEDWQFDRALSTPPTPVTPGTPTVMTPQQPPPPAAPGPDLSRQIEAINKLEVKIIPHWNGSVADFPRTMRVTRQVCKNFGMGDVVKTTTTPPANDGSLQWKLWERQNDFVCTAFMIRFTGGQASIIVRQNVDKEENGWLSYKAIVDHYESPANKAAAITHIMAQLTQLVYTPRSNFSIIVHLTKFHHPDS